MRRVCVIVAAAGLVLAGWFAPGGAQAAPGDVGLAVGGLSQTGRWITDGSGRVVVLHGFNQVFKVPPYEPSADGFGDDDAAFLAANGFNGMRVGVIWAAVEPQPGVYDDGYLDSVDETVRTLAAHGIVSLIDFHQDQYNEKFQGEGAPAWAVPPSSTPNPALGFPYNYLFNPAEWQVWDRFWNNYKAPDGVGLQDHLAGAWAHVAARFAGDQAVAGYDVLNEPWPGSFGVVCATPQVGCRAFDAGKLTAFYKRIDHAIRTADTTHTVYVEPNPLFTQSSVTGLGAIGDAHSGFSYHVYCSTQSFFQTNVACAQQDELTISGATRYATNHRMPPLLTEFGATMDLANLAEMTGLTDKYRTGWLEWAYSGNDITSSSPEGQALVLDPSQPPTGANVVTGKLAALATPYPQLVAGTPTSWSFAGGVFRLTYSTTRAAGLLRFPAGSQTR
ncbi:MAG: endoglycosylceramidase, partial [Pseudonocardiales bacterium]|nr:endoglycosylceramidase [Pseudonocardiales bacterium]